MTSSQDLYKRKARITIENTKYKFDMELDDLEIRFYCNFDSNSTPNTCKLEIFNLTSSTISKITKNSKVTVSAGYRHDLGLITEGLVTNKATYEDGSDKMTKVIFKEGFDKSHIKVTGKTATNPKKHFVMKKTKLKKPIKSVTTTKDGKKVTKTVKYKKTKQLEYKKSTLNITFKKGTRASTIIRKLCSVLGIKISKMNLPKDHVYKSGFKVSGGIENKLKRVVRDCKASMYWVRGAVVIRSIEIGDDNRFVLKESTGLISVEEWEEDKKKGVIITALLCHRMTTASIITIDNKEYKGKYRVMSGKHYYDGTDFMTTAKLLKV